MYNVFLYLSMLLQLANPSFKERQKAYTYLMANPHRLAHCGLYHPHTEIRLRSENILEAYYEKRVQEFGYMPMIDSAWYDMKTNTYLATKDCLFLGKYPATHLKDILDISISYETNNNLDRYRLATRYWVKGLLYTNVDDKDIHHALNTLRKIDIEYLKRVQHDTYPLYTYIEAKAHGL